MIITRITFRLCHLFVVDSIFSNVLHNAAYGTLRFQNEPSNWNITTDSEDTYGSPFFQVAPVDSRDDASLDTLRAVRISSDWPSASYLQWVYLTFWQSLLPSRLHRSLRHRALLFQPPPMKPGTLPSTDSVEVSPFARRQQFPQGRQLPTPEVVLIGVESKGSVHTLTGFDTVLSTSVSESDSTIIIFIRFVGLFAALNVVLLETLFLREDRGWSPLTASSPLLSSMAELMFSFSVATRP